MDYLCELINVNKYIHTKKGIALSICDVCQSKDCTNPIEYIDYSIYGVNTRCRVFNRGSTPYFVTSCAGFLTEEKIKKDDVIMKESEEKHENK